MNALLQAALMGTARQTPPPATLPDGLAVTGSSEEQRLLKEAALLAVYHEAGATPIRARALPEPAPPEDRPLAPSTQLRMIVGGPYVAVLPEWLDTIAAAGQVIPHEFVPVLLASPDRELSLRLEPVLSHRARWLAQQAGWEWALPGEPRERWETGSASARLHVLKATRRTDPEAARALIESTAREDSARDRERFIGALHDRLSLDDEPLLEAALDDRGNAVRATAARLLASLTDSAYARRMAARLEPLIRHGRRTLTVELPEFDEEMRRDGIDDRPPQGVGRGAYVLHQLAERAPLSLWGSEPPKRVADGMGDVLRNAWTTAAIAQRNTAWAKALAEKQPTSELLAVVDQETAERLTPRSGPPPRGRWTRRFTQEIAAWDEAPPRWLRALGLHGDPTVTLDPHTEAGDLLAFRRSMLEELQ